MIGFVVGFKIGFLVESGKYMCVTGFLFQLSQFIGTITVYWHCHRLLTLSQVIYLSAGVFVVSQQYLRII